MHDGGSVLHLTQSPGPTATSTDGYDDSVQMYPLDTPTDVNGGRNNKSPRRRPEKILAPVRPARSAISSDSCDAVTGHDGLDWDSSFMPIRRDSTA